MECLKGSSPEKAPVGEKQQAKSIADQAATIAKLRGLGGADSRPVVGRFDDEEQSSDDGIIGEVLGMFGHSEGVEEHAGGAQEEDVESKRQEVIS